jgi:hypothetical protein
MAANQGDGAKSPKTRVPTARNENGDFTNLGSGSKLTSFTWITETGNTLQQLLS